LLLVPLALAAAPAARAGFWGRDRLASSWAGKPVKIDGEDDEWPEVGAFEDDGVGIQAMNDGASLFLKATSSTREGRAQLIGLARQDVAFWFYAADGKKRSWGLLVPFSRMTPPDEDELRYGPVVSDPSSGVKPELLIDRSVAGSTTTVVSTEAWPTDMDFRIGFSGRRPVWEMRIPLARLTPTAKGAIPIDFVVSGKTMKLATQRRPGDGGAKGDSEKGGGRGGAHGGGGPRAPAGPSSAEPFEFLLSVRLAPDPATLR
jgi:hypothetical protein